MIAIFSTMKSASINLHLSQHPITDTSPRKPSQRTSRMSEMEINSIQQSAINNMIQRVKKRNMNQEEIEVEEVYVEDKGNMVSYLPNCVDNDDLKRKFYRRSDGITSGWNNTDLFYADGDGELMQITEEMVNKFFDAKYPGWTRTGTPDWVKNCEDYAKSSEGYKESNKKSYINNDSNSKEKLKEILTTVGNYVINISYHWMRVERNEKGITIRQKDGESAVYSKEFTLDGGINYIIDNLGMSGVNVYES